MTESGVGFLGKGSETPTHQLRGLRERCKLLLRGPGGSPENLDLGAFGDLRNIIRTVR